MPHARLRRAATGFSWIATVTSLFLLLVTGPAVLVRRPDASEFVRELAFTTAFGARLVWPALVVLAITVVGALVLAIVRSSLRSTGRAAAIALGILAMGVAWTAGIRPPASRVGVFDGIYAPDPLSFSAGMLFPCAELAHALPRGAQLGWAGSVDTTLIVAVPEPKGGWYGSRPKDWPDTYSDVHGQPYYRVRLRGRLVGPGQHGWPPFAQYRLDVDSVVNVRARRRRDDLDC